jgi:hypothetical protein
MSLISSLAGGVINFTANIIIFIAIHIPFLTSVLIGNPVVSTDLVASSTPHLVTRSVAVTNIKSLLINATSSLIVSPSCPLGSESFLKKQNITPQFQIHCVISTLPINTNKKLVQLVTIIYGTTGGGSESSDVVYPLEIKAVILPAGDLIVDNGISNIPALLTHTAAFKVAALSGKDESCWGGGGCPADNNYVTLEGSIQGPDNLNNYCGMYMAVSPVTSRYTVCINASSTNQSTFDLIKN